jgi:hypothetical protein
VQQGILQAALVSNLNVVQGQILPPKFTSQHNLSKKDNSKVTGRIAGILAACLLHGTAGHASHD